VVAVAAVALGWAPATQAAEPPLDTCLSDGPPPTFAGHGFPLDGAPGAGTTEAEWAFAFPNLVFDRPLQVTHAGDGSDRLFVVEQSGRIKVFPNDPAATTAKTFLNLSSRVAFEGEKGLLGLAFAPDYASSGVFYVNYVGTPETCPSGGSGICTWVERYRVSAGDPDSADPASGERILRFSQPFGNHNGGMLAFGPQDGLLYISTGDGGGGGDPLEQAQDRTTLLGNILRIDVSRTDPGLAYAIPPGNPYVGNTQGFREEIWAHGLRNPWRFSFDRETGDLWIGDVGQATWEEIDFVPASRVAAGGDNFGWDVCEANADFEGSCDSLASTRPIHAYGRSVGTSVTGGFVYRGPGLPSLQGTYVFADFNGATFALPGGGAGGDAELLDANPTGIAGFGEDESGELYAANLLSGKILRLAPTSGGAGWPALLSQTGLFDDVPGLDPAPGLVEYRVNARLWSDGAAKRRFMALPDGGRIGFEPTGAWSFPVGTAFVKHFELDLADGSTRRLETRVFLRQNPGWTGVTYRWNDAQQDAELVLESAQQVFQVAGSGGPEARTWTYPSPTDCLSCHTEAAGFVLGPRTRQLNRLVDCALASENQLDAWNGAGLFTSDVGAAASHGAFADPSNPFEPVEDRVRAYLDVNCSVCHQPAGPAPTDIDLRFDTPLVSANLVGANVTGETFGLVDPRRVFPGDRTRSVLWHRIQSRVTGERMPAASAVPDPLAVALMGYWIDALPSSGTDSDDDGVGDLADNCIASANAAQQDVDGDRFGDRCDCDFDDDQVCLSSDSDIFLADLALGFDDSGDGTDLDSDGDVDYDDFALFAAQATTGEPGPSALRGPRDRDGDGVSDGQDNCTLLVNASQIDTDGDDFGNWCDCDLDQNRVCDSADFLILVQDANTGTDRGVGSDMNGDGTVDGDDGALILLGIDRGTPGPSFPGGNLEREMRVGCGSGHAEAFAVVIPMGLWMGRRRARRRDRR
jgi:uncharacterized repeat protein (TIGR03806 family)